MNPFVTGGTGLALSSQAKLKSFFLWLRTTFGTTRSDLVLVVVFGQYF